MNISILTVFKELYTPFLNTSLIKRAQDDKRVSFDLDSFFSHADVKKRIDAPSFGPGAGMLIKPDIVEKGIDALEAKHGNAYKIFFSPHGKKLDQNLLKQIAKKAQDTKHLMLIPARYEGMDARIEEKYADEIVSVGDFVLMGGDIPAMLLLEGMLRLIPGVVGKQESVETDSFSGPFVDYPEYTEPVDWHGMLVPDVVRSGNHAEIKKWRENQAVQRTVLGHFDWMRTRQLDKKQEALARAVIPSHYVALMHGDVIVDGQPGNSSVMSIDIHDIARSSATYGMQDYFIVTPLIDQQKIVKKFLSFWDTQGPSYNQNRHEAITRVRIAESLDEVLKAIEEKEGKKPLLVATSARRVVGAESITFYDQDRVWMQGRPVLFLFGTADGLAQSVIERSDYILPPLCGLSDFNHLSVRSAAAIVFDRWLGMNPQFSAEKSQSEIAK